MRASSHFVSSYHLTSSTGGSLARAMAPSQARRARGYAAGSPRERETPLQAFEWVDLRASG